MTPPATRHLPLSTMGQIQSSVGLVSGIPIQQTVDQLIAVSAQPRNILANRTAALESERLAVETLSSLVLAFQFEVDKLDDSDLFNSRAVTSSNTDALSASVSAGGTPALGSYQFTPVRLASSHQVLSQSFATGSTIGAGSFTFRVGGFVDKGIALDELNGDAGFQRGEIRITDRSGASSVVDLRFATSVDDVIEAINSNTEVNVTAEADGDAFKLTDNTGGSGNLQVQEVGIGTTAASLGLDGINVAADEATGNDIFTLHTGTRLSFLNDGNGVQIKGEGTDDLTVTFRDGSADLSIDLAESTTVGDVLEALNADGRLVAAISADGNRLEVTDQTTGGGTFSIASAGSGTAAEDLGIVGSTTSATITGTRVVSGLRDVLVTSLGGGSGFGTLGQIDFTNRDGVTSTVDLSTEETLGEVINAIDSFAIGISAAINAERHGIEITDTTGGSASNLIIADGDGTGTATALGIAIDDAVTSSNSGSLGRQTISEATLLTSLNSGTGIDLGDFIITDSAGIAGAVDLNKVGDEAVTIGDVIERINDSNANVLARINDSGDGIVIIDQAVGNETLTVREVGSGSTAEDLGLLRDAVSGQIDGTSTQTVTIDAEHTLADVVDTINGLEAGVSASVLNDGNGQRLLLSVDEAGADNELLLDASGSPFSFQESSSAKDGLLLFGTAENAEFGLLIPSQSNTFEDIVNGLDLTIQSATQETVTIDVEESSSSLVDAVQDFVDAYNSIRTNLDTVTAFNAEDATTGILFGTTVALRVDADLSQAIGDRYFGHGRYQTLEELGVSFDDDGRLTFDSAELEEAFAEDPDAVTALLSDETSGVVAAIDRAVESLAGEDNSLLSSRSESLADIVENNNDRIAFLDERLAAERERLLSEFAQLELLIAEFQSSLSDLSNLQILEPVTSSGVGATTLFGA